MQIGASLALRVESIAWASRSAVVDAFALAAAQGRVSLDGPSHS